MTEQSSKGDFPQSLRLLDRIWRKENQEKASSCSMRRTITEEGKTWSRLIEPGGIVQLRYRSRRVGARVTKAAASEFVGQILSFETSKPKFEDLTQNDFIAFQEENIFGYDPPAKI